MRGSESDRLGPELEQRGGEGRGGAGRPHTDTASRAPTTWAGALVGPTSLAAGYPLACMARAPRAAPPTSGYSACAGGSPGGGTEAERLRLAQRDVDQAGTRTQWRGAA